MANVGGLANNGATLGKVTGVLAPSNSYGTGTSAQNLAQAPKPVPSQSMIPQGSQVGLIGNHTLGSTTDNAGNVTKYNAPKSNPSVLAQQQALNKQGAGLVEDGIAGPKTEAAIAKYSTSISSPTSVPTPPNQTPTPTSPVPTTPQVGTTMQNAQNVLNAGQMSPEELAANKDVAEANALQKSYQNVQTLSPYAEAGMFTDRARTPAEIQALEQSPDLAGRANAEQGLFGSLGNIYGSSRVAGANAELQGTQTAAQRGLSAAGTVLNSSLLSPTAAGQASFSGLNGYQGANSSQFGNPNDPASASNAQAYKTYYDQYNAGLGGLNQAAAIEPSIISTITSNPQLNNQPLSAISDLSLFLSGQTSQPGQQQLSTDVANYIKNLGIDPATLQSNIASQQSGTLVQLLNNLKSIATKNNNALKTTADSLKTSTSTNTDSTKTGTGGLYDF